MARLMRTYKALIGALMLVLMMWTGGLAHAAEQAGCIPATAESAAHFEGDDDEAPSDSDQGTAHHHWSCSGHQLTAPSEHAGPGLQGSSASLPFPRRQAGLQGHDPDRQLRPPIA